MTRIRPHCGQSVNPVSAASARAVSSSAADRSRWQPVHCLPSSRDTTTPNWGRPRSYRARTSAGIDSTTAPLPAASSSTWRSMSATAAASAPSADSSVAPDRGLVGEVRDEVGFEGRLLLHRFEFADVEFVALGGERGDLVHQRLRLARGDHGLQLPLEPIEMRGQFGAVLLVGLDLRLEFGDAAPDRVTALLPRSHPCGGLVELFAQRRPFTLHTQLIGQRVDPLEFDEVLGEGGHRRSVCQVPMCQVPM